MPYSQQISRQLLLAKNRKLFYLFLTTNEKITKKAVDSLNLQDKNFYNTKNSFIFEDQEIIVFKAQQQISYDKINIQKANDIVVFEDIFAGRQQDLPTYNIHIYNDDLLQNQQIMKLNETQLPNYVCFQYKDVFIVNDYSKGDDSRQTVNKFNFSDNAIYCKYNFSDIAKVELQDKYNYVVLNFIDGYVYQLYIDDEFITQLNQNVLFDNMFFKQVYSFAKDRNIYLKLNKITEDNQKIKVKTFLLTPIRLFQFNLKDLIIEDEDYFSANQRYISNTVKFSVSQPNQYSFLQKNIYHSNDICQVYTASFSTDLNFISNNIQFQILNNYNVQFNNYIVMHPKSMITIFIDFTKYNSQKLIKEQLLLYVKKIILNFDSNVKQNDVIFYYKSGFSRNDISKKNYEIYDENKCFYCNCLQLVINYNGDKSFVFNSIDILAFNFKNNCLITDDTMIDEKNRIIISKQKILDGQFGNYILNNQNISNQQWNQNHKYANNIVLQNVKTNNDKQFFVNNQETSQLTFKLKSDVIREQYLNIYVQYIKRKKNSDNLFNFEHFQLFDRKYNFPKHVNLIHNNKKYQFGYTGFIQNEAGDVLKQRWDIVQMPNGLQGQQKPYFQFCKKNTNNGWKLYFIINMLNLFPTIYEIQLDKQKLKFDYEFDQGNIIKNNFLIEESVYGLNLKIQPIEEKKAYIKLYTRIDVNYAWQQIIESAIAGVITNREIKIEWRDGQKEYIEVYGIIMSKNKLLENLTTTQSYKLSNFKNDQLTVSILKNDQLTVDKNKVLSNFYCNALCGLNYYYAGKNYQYFSLNKPHFNAVNQIYYKDRSNLHVEWENNDNYYYLIWMDEFRQDDFSESGEYYQYLEPFFNFSINKLADKNYIVKSYDKFNYHIQQQMFQFQFAESKNILMFTGLNTKKLSNNFKADCFYSYTLDDFNWTEWEYAKDINPFVAKKIKLKRIILKKKDEFLNFDKVCLKYVNTNNYYLTNKDYFETIYLTKFKENTKYFLNLIVIHKDKTNCGKFKIFGVQNVKYIEKIYQLYVDGKLVNQEDIVMLSGIDKWCTFSWKINDQSFLKSDFVLYAYKDKKYILLQQLQKTKDDLTIDESSHLYSFKYNFKDVGFDYFVFDVRWYDTNYNVSDYCFSDDPQYMAKFKFNKLPTTPNKLDVEGIQF